MKTLTIKDFVIENISVGEPGSAAPPGYNFVVVNDDFAAGVGWTWDGEIATDPTPPPTPEPVADWFGFNAAFLGNSYWVILAETLNRFSPSVLIGVGAAASVANAPALQSAYSLAIAYLLSATPSIPAEALSDWQAFIAIYLNEDQTGLANAIREEWQAIADFHNIPIIF